ncbi:hypothetical protein FRC12_019609, partial [Ceratobasidium sp. 428]
LPSALPAYTSPYPPPTPPSFRSRRPSYSSQNRPHPYRRPEAGARQSPRTVLDPLYDWSRHGSPNPSLSNPRTATPMASTRYHTPLSQSRFATPRPPSTPASNTPFFSPTLENLAVPSPTFVHHPDSQSYLPQPRSAFDSISQALSAGTVAASVQMPPHNPGTFGDPNEPLLAFDTPNFEGDMNETPAPATPLIAPQPSAAEQNTLAWMARSQDNARRPLFLSEDSSPQADAYVVSPALTPSPASRARPTTISLLSSPTAPAFPAAPVIPAAPVVLAAPVIPAAPAVLATPTIAHIARAPPGAPATNVAVVTSYPHSAHSTVLPYQESAMPIRPGSETSDDVDQELAEAWGMDLRDTGFQSSDSWVDEPVDELNPSSSIQAQGTQSGSSKARASGSPRSNRRQQKKPMAVGDKWLGGPGGGFKFNSKPAGADESMLRKARWSYSEDGPALQDPNERIEGDMHFSPATEPGDEVFICWVCTLLSVGLMQWVCFRAGQLHPQYVGSVFKPPQLPHTPPRWIKESSYKSTQL